MPLIISAKLQCLSITVEDVDQNLVIILTEQAACRLSLFPTERDCCYEEVCLGWHLGQTLTGFGGGFVLLCSKFQQSPKEQVPAY